MWVNSMNYSLVRLNYVSETMTTVRKGTADKWQASLGAAFEECLIKASSAKNEICGEMGGGQGIKEETHFS